MPEEPIGPNQWALKIVGGMRALLASGGWAIMEAHLTQMRDEEARRVLDADELDPEEREYHRIRYGVFKGILEWPAAQLAVQEQFLKAHGGKGDDLPDED